MNSINKEILVAIENLNITNSVEVFEGQNKDDILNELKKIYVVGNPRVWWLSLKFIPKSFTFQGDESYKEIINFFDKDEVAWFIIEDEEQILLRTRVKYIIDIISDCSYFEYNIISFDNKKFLCENDHNEFLYINIDEV